jgi:hypothetical protein
MDEAAADQFGTVRSRAGSESWQLESVEDFEDKALAES